MFLILRSVKNRMEQQEGINFTEFSYQIFQAYDFYRLYSDHDCTIQVSLPCCELCNKSVFFTNMFPLSTAWRQRPVG